MLIVHVGLNAEEQDFHNPVGSMVFMILLNGQIQSVVVPLVQVCGTLWRVESQALFIP